MGSGTKQPAVVVVLLCVAGYLTLVGLALLLMWAAGTIGVGAVFFPLAFVGMLIDEDGDGRYYGLVYALLAGVGVWQLGVGATFFLGSYLACACVALGLALLALAMAWIALARTAVVALALVRSLVRGPTERDLRTLMYPFAALVLDDESSQDFTLERALLWLAEWESYGALWRVWLVMSFPYCTIRDARHERSALRAPVRE